MAKNVRSEMLHFPPTLSKEAKKLLEQLLSRTPSKRPTPLEIKQHPWFQSINWTDAADRSLPVPKDLPIRRLHETATWSSIIPK